MTALTPRPHGPKARAAAQEARLDQLFAPAIHSGRLDGCRLDWTERFQTTTISTRLDVSQHGTPRSDTVTTDTDPNTLGPEVFSTGRGGRLHHLANFTHHDLRSAAPYLSVDLILAGGGRFHSTGPHLVPLLQAVLKRVSEQRNTPNGEERVERLSTSILRPLSTTSDQQYRLTWNATDDALELSESRRETGRTTTWDDTGQVTMPLPILRASAAGQPTRPLDEAVIRLFHDMNSLMLDCMNRNTANTDVTVLLDTDSQLQLKHGAVRHGPNNTETLKNLGEQRHEIKNLLARAELPRANFGRNEPNPKRQVTLKASGAPIFLTLSADLCLILARLCQAWQSGSRAVLLWSEDGRNDLTIMPLDNQTAALIITPSYDSGSHLMFALGDALRTLVAANRTYLQTVLAPNPD